MPAVYNGMTFLRTAYNTVAAVNTAIGIILNLALLNKGFGIMTPPASIAASFEKYRCPYPRPVMNRKALYVEYLTGYFLFTSLTCLIGVTYITHIAAPYI
jgi:hypothetical protein